MSKPIKSRSERAKNIRECPRCKKKTLRITNVMSTTEEIHWGCSNCCYKEKVPYGKKVRENPQRKLLEVNDD